MLIADRLHEFGKGGDMYFRRVFVELDLDLRHHSSDGFVPAIARHLVERGIEIAAAQRGELHLCAIIDGLNLTDIPATPLQISVFGDFLSARLDGLADEARAADLECETSLLGGIAWKELLRQSDDWAADLILAGAGSHLNQLGPTALKLIRSAKCPVLIERPKAQSTGPEGSDDDGEPLHVLIADKLSSADGEMIMTLIGSGLWRDAKCWLLHVIEPDRWPEPWQDSLSQETLAQRQAMRVESARLRLHEHLSPTDHRTMTYGILPQVAEGELFATLQRLIEEWQIDLLICRAGFRMDAVLPYVRCSVLSFPRSECEVSGAQ